jgi:hypothetical protein
MPSGISIITMKRKYPQFTPDELSNLINEYFIYIKGKSKLKRAPNNGQAKYNYTKVYDPLPQPATFTGLALFLGFSSLRSFEDYRPKGSISQILKQGCLRVEAEYEKRLHEHYTSGPIFALKSRGWNDGKTTEQPTAARSLNIKIIDTGPKPAGTEKEVIIED